jgi:hypothetical protein
MGIYVLLQRQLYLFYLTLTDSLILALKISHLPNEESEIVSFSGQSTGAALPYKVY